MLSACSKNSHRLMAVARASTQACTTALSVEPCEVRAMVVLDGLRDLSRGEVVSEPCRTARAVLGGQQVEQHQRVGLLGCLVAVDIVVLGFENAVEPSGCCRNARGSCPSRVRQGCS